MIRIGLIPGAQLTGSLLGVLLARAAWGPSLANPPVSYAALRPAPRLVERHGLPSRGRQYGPDYRSCRRLPVRATAGTRVPWLVGGLIGAAIAGLGTITGGCVNPARQFGPAVFAGQFGFLTAYLLAPLAGAVAATWLLARFQHREVLTHRLCGDLNADAGQDVRP